jgi:hypothetical protein
MNNDYTKLFLREIAGVLVVFLLGYIGSLIYNWFGMIWMVIYIVIVAIMVTIILGRKLKIK